MNTAVMGGGSRNSRSSAKKIKRELKQRVMAMMKKLRTKAGHTSDDGWITVVLGLAW